MKLKPQELLDWREHPTTAKIFALFKKIREELKEDLVSGEYSFPEADSTAMSHAKIIGQCSALERILNIEYEDFINEGLIQEEEENVDSDTKPEADAR